MHTGRPEEQVSFAHSILSFQMRENVNTRVEVEARVALNTNPSVVSSFPLKMLIWPWLWGAEIELTVITWPDLYGKHINRRLRRLLTPYLT